MVANIYAALHVSHQLQRSLCRKLLRARADVQKRRELFRSLRIELAAHAAAEERFLYAPILMDDAGLNSSRHALSEHHEIDELVEQLSATVGDSRRWRASAEALSHEVHHHLREEETRFFQVSGKILTRTQKKRLGTRYQKDYERMRRVLSGSS